MLLWSAIFAGCGFIEKSYPIWFINNDNAIIYVQVSENYPDSSVLQTNEFLIKVKSNEKQLIYDFDKPQDKSFPIYFPRDTMLLFVFNADTLKQYSWEEIRIGKKFNKQISFSKTDLKTSKWTVEYP